MCDVPKYIARARARVCVYNEDIFIYYIEKKSSIFAALQYIPIRKNISSRTRTRL